jgi:hypothetical protein
MRRGDMLLLSPPEAPEALEVLIAAATAAPVVGEVSPRMARTDCETPRGS